MMTQVTGDHGSPGDEQDAEDQFDRRVSDILDAEADQLHRYAEQLLTTGAISIERRAGQVTARFSRPAWRRHGFLAWHRRPVLEIESAAANGSYGSTGHVPMVTKYRNRSGVIDEIVLQLAFQLAELEEGAE
jgi:hypothetical protein